MLRVTPIEFFARGIPEAFLFFFAVYAFAKRFINIKRYIISSVLYGIMAYIVRFFPIHYGVHTIMNVFIIIILSVNINNIDLIGAIRSSIMIIILQFICEGINVFIVQHVFNVNISYVFRDPLLKILYGIPAVLIFLFVVIWYYITLLKRKELKYI